MKKVYYILLIGVTLFVIVSQMREWKNKEKKNIFESQLHKALVIYADKYESLPEESSNSSLVKFLAQKNLIDSEKVESPFKYFINDDGESFTLIFDD